jgi:hypothetical protein
MVPPMKTTPNPVVRTANQVVAEAAPALISRGFALDRRLLCKGGGLLSS